MQLRDVIGLIGLALLLDDARDIGKFDRLHHWQLGAAMMVTPGLFENIFLAQQKIQKF